MPKKEMRVFGNRSVAPADLKKYGPTMSELELAEYLGISLVHARRHRSPQYVARGISWPKHRREGGERSVVFFKRAEVLKWVKTLARQD